MDTYEIQREALLNALENARDRGDRAAEDEIQADLDHGALMLALREM